MVMLLDMNCNSVQQNLIDLLQNCLYLIGAHINFNQIILVVVLVITVY